MTAHQKARRNAHYSGFNKRTHQTQHVLKVASEWSLHNLGITWPDCKDQNIQIIRTMNPSTVISFSITIKTVHKNEKIGTDITHPAIQEMDGIVSNSRLFKMDNHLNRLMGTNSWNPQKSEIQWLKTVSAFTVQVINSIQTHAMQGAVFHL